MSKFLLNYSGLLSLDECIDFYGVDPRECLLPGGFGSQCFWQSGSLKYWPNHCNVEGRTIIPPGLYGAVISLRRLLNHCGHKMPTNKREMFELELAAMLLVNSGL